jgi:predicted DNA-binding transcriptional regulator AlpA
MKKMKKMKKMENTQEKDMERLMSVRDVAELLKCSSHHVYMLKTYGKIPKPIKLGRILRWRRGVIEKWIEEGCPSQTKNSENFSRWKR